MRYMWCKETIPTPSKTPKVSSMVRLAANISYILATQITNKPWNEVWFPPFFLDIGQNMFFFQLNRIRQCFKPMSSQNVVLHIDRQSTAYPSRGKARSKGKIMSSIWRPSVWYRIFFLFMHIYFCYFLF